MVSVGLAGLEAPPTKRMGLLSGVAVAAIPLRRDRHQYRTNPFMFVFFRAARRVFSRVMGKRRSAFIRRRTAWRINPTLRSSVWHLHIKNHLPLRDESDFMIRQGKEYPAIQRDFRKKLLQREVGTQGESQALLSQARISMLEFWRHDEANALALGILRDRAFLYVCDQLPKGFPLNFDATDPDLLRVMAESCIVFQRQRPPIRPR